MKSYMLGFYAVMLLWLLVSFSVQDDVVKRSSCLTTTDTRAPQRNLVSYKLQHKSLFSVEAVRFLTISGKELCSNPSSPWAIKSMKYLDAKKKQSVSNKTARRSVTAVPVNTSTRNMIRLSAQI